MLKLVTRRPTKIVILFRSKDLDAATAVQQYYEDIRPKWSTSHIMLLQWGGYWRVCRLRQMKPEVVQHLNDLWKRWMNSQGAYHASRRRINETSKHYARLLAETDPASIPVNWHSYEDNLRRQASTYVGQHPELWRDPAPVPAPHVGTFNTATYTAANTPPTATATYEVETVWTEDM